jgi:hypothetical protein
MNFLAVQEVVATKRVWSAKRAEWRALAGYSDTCDELVIKMFDILLLNHSICRQKN